MRNMIRLSARSRSLLKHAGDVFSLKVALGACHLADTLGTTIPNKFSTTFSKSRLLNLTFMHFYFINILDFGKNNRLSYVEKFI